MFPVGDNLRLQAMDKVADGHQHGRHLFLIGIAARVAAQVRHLGVYLPMQARLLSTALYTVEHTHPEGIGTLSTGARVVQVALTLVEAPAPKSPPLGRHRKVERPRSNLL